MSDHQYKFNVSMSCGGCSGAVERVLKKLEASALNRFADFLSSSAGVKSFDVNLESQTANVVTEPSVPYDTVLATIKKTGKTVNSGEADGQTMSV
ncbi:HMA, heavy metal-associated [Aspergillus niger]|uniref:HMA, heavy metal-associated n=1 Tax=Aspergillus niger TaxID=5061 RepID=A0A100IHF1_ASPNG|nr:HMA, heavy metal-associated [Aspergillus niger]